MLKKKKKEKKMRRGGVDKKKDHRWQEGLLHFLVLVLQSSFFEMVMCTVTPPLPVTPFPSGRQLAFQRREQAIFFHFGINTFTDRETGTGYDDPSIFNPEGLDARQWVREAKNAGFKIVILTAKHADGFCLWPTAYTDYSVKASPWKNGTGDVVREVADAAKEQGLEFGLYLSPWDRHEATYGDTMLYNEFYLAQMRELLTLYGPISEVFLDGNKGTETRDMVYLFPIWFTLIHQLQPNANIFSDAGPDVRWVGDETGEAGVTSWSMINSTEVTIGGAEEAYLNEGDISGLDWVPPERDVSIRPGWFWHKYQQPRSVETLIDIYFKSVGRNCVMLLNTPPNSTGLLHDTDVKILHEFKSTIESIFSQNLASKARISASSTRGSEASSVENSPFRPEQVLTDDLNEYWAAEDGLSSGHLQLDLGANVTFNVVKIQEAVNMGQRVKKYHVDVWQGASWHTVVHGTTIGYKKLDRITLTSTQLVRFVIDDARAQPLIASFGLYLDARAKVTCGGSNSTCLSSPAIKTVSVI